jgi:hypothetical protein
MIWRDRIPQEMTYRYKIYSRLKKSHREEHLNLNYLNKKIFVSCSFESFGNVKIQYLNLFLNKFNPIFIQ